MIVNYWAGTITAEIILQHSNPETWANGWLVRAKAAAKNGRYLVVFELPNKHSTDIIQEIETILQNDFGELPPGLLMPEDL